MLAQKRYDYILKQLGLHGSITVYDICEALKVSAETVRRDFIFLEKQGSLKRVFGGAVVLEKQNHFESLQNRMDSNAELKAELSKSAVSFIEENDIIAIQSGSTAIEFAKALLSCDLKITVITYSNTVFNILKSKFHVILIGGDYIEEDDCFGGCFTEEFLKRFHVNKSFIFPAAISIENGIESYYLPTITTDKIYTDIADKVFVLADSEKFKSRGTFKTMDINENFIYITDSKVSEDVKKAFRDKGYMLFAGENNAEIK